MQKDIQSWWAKVRDKEDPNSIIGRETDVELQKERFLALSGVSFDVQQGEAIGIIGKNGAGKSTLLKLLSRITYPTRGTIKIKGKISSLLEVGTGFHRELSGRENIYLNGAILGMKKSVTEKRMDAIIDFAGIEKHLDTPVKRYSSGMSVRLAFSVAAHLDADILIMDEVLAVGDAEFQKKCLGKMNDVATNQGRTILFVSHNMGSVAELCPKSIMLQKGKVEMIGDTSDVISHYMNIHSETVGTVDLTDWNESRVFIGPYRFTRVSLLDENGTTKNAFKNGDKIRLKMDISGSKGEAFNVRASVRSDSGTVIVGYIGVNDGFGPTFVSDKAEIVAEFDCIFNTGTYSVTCVLTDRFNKYCDVVKCCLTFSVMSCEGTFKSVGLIRQNAKWKIL